MGDDNNGAALPEGPPEGSLGALLPYIGGKSKQAGWILAHCPPHRVYMEAFAGAISVLLAKNPSDVEIVNDINGDWMHMLFTIRNQPEEFYEFLAQIPYSRAVYQSWATDWKLGIKGATPLERAARRYYLTSTSFSSKFLSSFRTGTGVNLAKRHFSQLDRIPPISRRLRNVVIEGMDYETFLRKYCTEPDHLIYLDPPYVMEKGKGRDYYAGSEVWDESDHRRLAGVIKELPGRFILSYYPHPLLDELYPEAEGWRRDYLQVRTSAANIKEREGESREFRTEMLIMNYTYGARRLF